MRTTSRRKRSAVPDLIDLPLEELDTPALLLDLQALDENLKRMSEFFQRRPSRLRPHFSSHRCAALAQRQITAGAALGMSCASVGEAEVLAERGFSNVQISNPALGARKAARIAAVAKKARLRVVVSDADQARAIDAAARAVEATVGVLVEIEIGAGRPAVSFGRPALELAHCVAGMSCLRFEGLQALEGSAAQVTDFERRAEAVRRALALALETREMLVENGLAAAVSGGSSSTYQIAGQIEGISEIQAGTYATMDWRCADLSPEFQVAQTVLARVIAKNGSGVVLDAGANSLGSEASPPRVKDHPEADVILLGDDHCLVRRGPGWNVGEVVQLVPSRAGAAAALYRQFCVHAEGRVVELWPIDAAGRLS